MKRLNRMCMTLLTMLLLSPLAAQDMQVNDDAGSALQFNVSIDMLDAGFSVLVWEDMRNGNTDIYAQIIGPDGLMRGDNFLVNDTETTGEQSNPDVCILDDGRFMVVWADASDGSTDIMGRLFGPDGMAHTGILSLVSAEDATIQTSPAIDSDGSSTFVLAWQHDPGAEADQHGIYATYIPLSDLSVNTVFPVATGSYHHLLPEVAMAADGHWVIAYYQGQAVGSAYPRVRLYTGTSDQTGTALDTSKPAGSISDYTTGICVAMLPTGEAMAVWNYRVTGSGSWPEIHANVYSADGTLQGDYTVVSPSAEATAQRPWVAADPRGGFAVVWQSDAVDGGDIHARLYDASGSALGAWLPICSAAGIQSDPEIVIDNRGFSLTTWTDTRNDAGDIYIRALGPVAPLNVVASQNAAGFISLSWDPPYAHTALDVSQYRIYRGTTSGDVNTLLAEVDLSTRGDAGPLLRNYIDTDVDTGATYYYRISAMMPGGESGKSEEVWGVAQSAAPAIQSAWFDGEPDMTGTRNHASWADAARVPIANTGVGHTIEASFLNSDTYLYFKVDAFYDNGTNWGDNLVLVLDCNGDGLWPESESSEGLLNFTLEDEAPLPLTAISGSYPDALSIGISEFGGPMHWGYHYFMSDGYAFYGALPLNSTPLNIAPGSTIGLAILLDDKSQFTPHQYGYEGHWPQGSIIYSASSLGRLTLASAPSDVEASEAMPESFVLYPNTPNPFNPATVISFETPRSAEMAIDIYNSRGQRVAGQEAVRYEAGRHQWRFNAAGLTSGIYIVRVSGEQWSATQKICLVK